MIYFNIFRQSMPVAQAFREAKAQAVIPLGDNGKPGGLVKNVSTCWISTLAMFR
jgi:hypothetical protein